MISCPIFRATLRTLPTFKILQPHPETQPALSGRAVKPNWCVTTSPSVSIKNSNRFQNDQRKSEWRMEEVKRERDGSILKEVRFELGFDELVGIC